MPRDNQVDGYIAKLEEPHKAIAQILRDLIFSIMPLTTEELKWSRPCYSINAQPVCAFQVCKQHISLTFDQGVSLPDPDALLEGNGKYMRHLKVPLTGIPAGTNALLRHAAKLSTSAR